MNKIYGKGLLDSVGDIFKETPLLTLLERMNKAEEEAKQRKIDTCIELMRTLIKSCKKNMRKQKTATGIMIWENELDVYDRVLTRLLSVKYLDLTLFNKKRGA